MNEIPQVVVVDEEYVLKQYNERIRYYWTASRHNKNAYKRYRSLSVILGALVTLVSSMAAAEFIQSVDALRIAFAVTTPLIAATLTIIGGLGQSFHWGATWRDMVVNATRLEKERDRFLATKPADRDLQNELDTLNTIVVSETINFFQRVLDSEIKPKGQTGSNSG